MMPGDIYSDFREHPELTADAQIQFDAYIKELADIAQAIRQNANDESNSVDAWREWEMSFRQFYKKLIIDACEDGTLPEGTEVYFAGSLAKSQATEYSDLDAFVILKDEKDREQVQAVFEKLNFLCFRMFVKNNQVFPDPVGINPGRLIGTVEGLYSILTSDMVDTKATVTSVLTSKPILGSYELGEELRERINKNQKFKDLLSARSCYDSVVNNFKAPKAGSSNFDLKMHVMRPLDFLLMGLREEFELYSEDGDHLSAPGTILRLKEKNLLDPRIIALIEDTYKAGMTKRFLTHAEQKKEHDSLPIDDEARVLLANIDRLRDFAQTRIDCLDHPEAVKPADEEESDLTVYGLAALIALGGALLGTGLAAAGVFVVPYIALPALAIIATAALVSVAALALGALVYGLGKLALAVLDKVSGSKNNEEDNEVLIPDVLISPSLSQLNHLNPARPPVQPLQEDDFASARSMDSDSEQHLSAEEESTSDSEIDGAYHDDEFGPQVKQSK